MRAWVYQHPKEVERVGEKKAAWAVGWYDPDGKRCQKSFGPGADGKKFAFRHCKKVEAQISEGTYNSPRSASWEAFRAKYEENSLGSLSPRTRDDAKLSLSHFERLINPVKMRSVTSEAIASFVVKRLGEQGVQRGESKLSPATVNKDLRNLRAAIRKAFKWGYLPKLPDFDFQREQGRLPTFIDADHFAAIYQACDSATLPNALPYSAADWWRGLLMFAYMTGWRIGSILALRRADVDLDKATAISRAADNKGKRDQLIPLHPIVVEHLRKLASFDPNVFPWNHTRSILHRNFWRLQQAAGVAPASKPRYGFHDLRRAFATMNAERLTPDALQALMQHKDYQTTQRYISMARQLTPAVASLYVPPMKVAARSG